MRYLLFVLLLILPVFAGAQTRVYVTQDQPQQIRQFRGGVDALNYFRFPIQGGHSIPASDSLWFVRVNPGDGNIYMWDGLTWKCVSCGSGSGADSSVFATNYRLDTTRSGLDARISVKLNDTAQAIRADFPDVSGYITQPTLDDTAQAIRSDMPDVSGLATQQGLNDTAAVLRDSIASLRGDIPDISGLVPQSRTITINGSTQNLSANRSWTIPVPDTSSLRADIDANSDSILAHRTAINGKEPIISAGTTSQYWRGDKTWQAFPFIPDSSDYWTRNDADTSLQNIRDEIDNLPAPPVTSVNGQTGNVVLQFMDTAYVSGDTIYAEKGGNTFVVGVMTGGGSLDTAAVSAIVADSLTNVIRQGGDTRGVADTIGTLDNENVVVIRNGIVTINLPSTGGAIIRGNSTTVNNVLQAENSAGTSVLVAQNNGMVGIGKVPANGFILDVAGSRAAGSLIRLQNTSSSGISGFSFSDNGGVTTGYLGYANASNSIFPSTFVINSTASIPLVLSYGNSKKIELTTSGAVKINPLSGADTALVGIDEDGNLLRKGINTLPFVPEGEFITLTDPSNEQITEDNTVIVVTLTGDASIILPDNPPVKSRAIIKVFGSANTLTVSPYGGGTIDQDADIEMMPKDSYMFIHIGNNDWIIL